jgi:hypothetical protein
MFDHSSDLQIYLQFNLGRLSSTSITTITMNIIRRQEQLRSIHQFQSEEEEEGGETSFCPRRIPVPIKYMH